MLCFIPIVGEFRDPDLLAGSSSMMIGQTLWLEFFTNRDWPVASAAAVVLLALLLAPLLPSTSGCSAARLQGRPMMCSSMSFGLLLPMEERTR